MVSVLKFQAVGSLEYTFKLPEDDEKLELRCRQQRKGKNEKSQFPNMNKKDTFHFSKRFSCKRKERVLQALPLPNSVEANFNF